MDLNKALSQLIYNPHSVDKITLIYIYICMAYVEQNKAIIIYTLRML